MSELEYRLCGADLSQRSEIVSFQIFPFATMIEAQKALDIMRACLNAMGFVTLQYLKYTYNLPANTNDNTYGWSDLSEANIIPVKNGYLLSLPGLRILSKLEVKT